MKKIKNLFATPKKAILSLMCVAAILLALGTGAVYASGAIAESSAIGAENAQNFAFADAGIDPVSAAVERTEFDFEMGQFVYEVEFTVNGTEYEYWIKASTGSVLKRRIEIITLDGSSVTATAEIALDQAKEKALADAGLSATQVTFTEGKLDVEDGISVYDICFYAENTEYDYEINAGTGDIYSKSREPMRAPSSKSEADMSVSRPENTQKEPETATQISLDTAKMKALADAGVSASDAIYTKAKLDYDDGIAVYEIEFHTRTHKYEYELYAATGAVHERSADALKTETTKLGSQTDDNVQHKPADTNKYIGIEKAKNIAVNKANLSVSGVTFKKAKLDFDDGIAVYEIEFYFNGMEYDCEMNASTGAILEYSCEQDD